MHADTSNRTDGQPSRRRRAGMLVAALGSVLMVGACSADDVADHATGAGSNGRQGSVAGGPNAWAGGPPAGRSPAQGRASSDEHGDLTPRIAVLPIATLTTPEIDGLLWMREEEKLAHDVYATLGDLWESRIFENIARAETTHADAVLTLLERYAIADPAAGNPVGVFADPSIQALYDDLVARGRTSLVEALTVGALIEDLDISDLQQRATDTPDIALVYDELERGSQNHLRAFVRNLDRQGASYAPTYISQQEFDSIISSPTEQGHAG